MAKREVILRLTRSAQVVQVVLLRERGRELLRIVSHHVNVC
jgi:hypothetical protein